MKKRKIRRFCLGIFLALCLCFVSCGKNGDGYSVGEETPSASESGEENQSGGSENGGIWTPPASFD